MRRALAGELGVSPQQLIRTRRLLLAKQLLTDTALPVVDVAFASGFQSLRRFNAAFREHYRLAPSRLRKESARGAKTVAVAPGREEFALDLPYRPPLDWEALLAFLAARATRGVEHVGAGRYARTVALSGARGWVAVEPSPRPGALRAHVSASLAPALLGVVGRLRALFDLAADPARVGSSLRSDALLRARVARRPGLRVPGAFDGFELLVRAILGQQVSVAAASTFAARLAERFGEPVATPHAELARLTPSAERLASARVDAIAAIGLTRARAESLGAAARAWRGGRARALGERRPGADARRPARAPRRRPLDRRVRADARARLARRLPERRSRAAARAAPRGRARRAGARRGVAPVARLRRPASLDRTRGEARMSSTPRSLHTIFASPLGALTVSSDGAGLTGVRFAEQAAVELSRRDDAAAVLARAREQLAAYFAGELRAFELPLAPRGSEFQRKVWAALLEIPFGATTSYGALARRLGRPSAARAVGAANGRNPIAILVPCHRVVGASGALTGYAGGLERKRWLLAHESVL